MEDATNLAAAKDSPAAARRLIREALEPYPTHVVEHAQLLTSELVTNAVVHGSPPIQLAIEIDGRTLRVAVSDGNPDTPVVQEAGAAHPGGRGLFIVDSFAQAWGVIAASADSFGKTVWFSLAL